ncbi:RnfABCDGE type electron transport complex subunit G [bacterium]|nr:RnfABCDGE type electron transport complex subunit G [bacterium]
MVLVLTLVCAVAALALSQVHNVTKEPIENAERAEQLKAIKAVLPAYDNDPLKDTKLEKFEGSSFVFHTGKKGQKIVGRAVKVASDSGYGGKIEIMLGIAPDGKITGIYILKHSETPGLGAKIEEKSFTDLFKGKSLAKSKISVKKDGGDIDQITGATISPRAVCYAVRKGLTAHKEFFQKQKNSETKKTTG